NRHFPRANPSSLRCSRLRKASTRPTLSLPHLPCVISSLPSHPHRESKWPEHRRETFRIWAKVKHRLPLERFGLPFRRPEPNPPARVANRRRMASKQLEPCRFRGVVHQHASLRNVASLDVKRQLLAKPLNKRL